MNAPNYQPRLSGARLGMELDTDVWLAAVAAAGAAPSIHNTQPWRFVVRPEAVELHLDPQRVLSVADPDGRAARLSCGAAVLNLRLALQANGIEPVVGLLPVRSHPTLLAIVRPAGHRAPTPNEVALHLAIPLRHSHRRPFHPAPVPQTALRAIVYAAGAEGGYLRLLQDPPMVSAVAALVRRAEQAQDALPAYQQELASWTFTNGRRTDGVPHLASGPKPEPGHPLPLRDFAPGVERPVRRYESDPLLGLLLSTGDTPLDELRCGQALQRALLTATTHGVGASIVSAPTEVPAVRGELRKLAGGTMWPQLLMRLGSALPTAGSPRRPTSEFVEIADSYRDDDLR